MFYRYHSLWIHRHLVYKISKPALDHRKVALGIIFGANFFVESASFQLMHMFALCMFVLVIAPIWVLFPGTVEGQTFTFVCAMRSSIQGSKGLKSYHFFRIIAHNLYKIQPQFESHLRAGRLRFQHGQFCNVFEFGQFPNIVISEYQQKGHLLDDIGSPEMQLKSFCINIFKVNIVSEFRTVN